MNSNNNHYQLAASELTLGYNNQTIVKKINLIIPQGKITVFIGANGSGKSTLLRGLARLLKPYSGSVYLDSKDIFKLPTKTVAQKLAILSQSPVAPEGLTVRDLVACGRYPYQNWLQTWTEKDEYWVEKALEITKIQELAERELDTLSGGQRQRAWIAMTLAQDAEILLLDEPTTFLDLAHQIELLDLLWELNQTQGKTLVMVLHDLNQACRYADYLIAIKEGSIYLQGKPEEVMEENIIQEVFGLVCQVIPDPVSGTPMCVPISKRTSLLDS